MTVCKICVWQKHYDFTKGCEHVMQVFLVNEAIVVLIDHVECLFELLYLRLVEHRKHVRCRPMGTVLCFTGCLCSRHDCYEQKHT